jgi:hypothetical protein
MGTGLKAVLLGDTRISTLSKPYLPAVVVGMETRTAFRAVALEGIR